MSSKPPRIPGIQKDVVSDFVDNIPWHKLTPAEAELAFQFANEYLNASPARDNPHRKEIFDARNARCRDAWLMRKRVGTAADGLPLDEFVEFLQQQPAGREGRPRPPSKYKRRYGNDDYAVTSQNPEDRLIDALDAGLSTTTKDPRK